MSASGKIQPKRSVNISADTMGRVTDLAVDEGDRVKKGQFLLQIDPRNLRTAVQRSEASLAAARSHDASSCSRARERASRAQARRGQPAAAAGALEGRADDARDARAGRERPEDPAGRSASQEQAIQTQQLRMQQEERRPRERAVQPQQGAHRVADRRHRHPPQHRGGRERRHRHDEQRRHGAADDCRHVGHRGGGRGRRDRHPERRRSGQVGQGHDRRDAGPDLHGQGDRDRQQPHSDDDRQPRATQATNFKVVVTIDDRDPDVRPGFTCTAEITTATRKNVVAVPIQATTVREMVVDEQGRDRPRRRRGDGEAAAAAGRRSRPPELPPGQTRKETEGVFVVTDGKAMFAPVKTGIAGDKYFEVLVRPEGRRRGRSPGRSPRCASWRTARR